jgi:hypothetical protein
LTRKDRKGKREYRKEREEERLRKIDPYPSPGPC